MVNGIKSPLVKPLAIDHDESAQAPTPVPPSRCQRYFVTARITISRAVLIDAESFVNRLAARTLLLTTSREKYPDLVERITDFLEDRGAVGILVARQTDGAPLEEVAMLYWSSRLKKSALRLEDLVTTALIGVVGSVIAGLIVEAWKGEFGPLGKLFNRNSMDRLSKIAESERRRSEDLAWLIELYLEKTRGQGVADTEAAERLYQAIAEGNSFRHHLGEPPTAAAGFAPIRHARAVAPAVLATEMERGKAPAVTTARSFRGLAISNRVAFGEIVVPARGDWEGRGDELLRRLNIPCIHPDLWPGERHREPTPKILVITDSQYEFARENGNHDLIALAAGVISIDSRMNSHLSHFLRNVDLGAISVPLADEELAEAKFALIDGERLHIFRHRPNVVAEDVARLIRPARRYRRFSD